MPAPSITRVDAQINTVSIFWDYQQAASLVEIVIYWCDMDKCNGNPSELSLDISLKLCTVRNLKPCVTYLVWMRARDSQGFLTSKSQTMRVNTFIEGNIISK